MSADGSEVWAMDAKLAGGVEELLKVLPAEIPSLAQARASSMMDQRELTFLAGALGASPAGDGTIVVEIGTYLGHTALFMAEVLATLGRSAPIFSIDAFDSVQPDPLNPQGSYAAFQAIMAQHHLQRTCMAVSGYSDAVAPLVAPTVAFLVVDGGHGYETARQDLAFYTTKVVPNGYVFVDDYGAAYPGVVRAVDEFFVPAAGFDVLHRSDFVIARRR
jgi:hypothetical protein